MGVALGEDADAASDKFIAPDENGEKFTHVSQTHNGIHHFSVELGLKIDDFKSLTLPSSL